MDGDLVMNGSKDNVQSRNRWEVVIQTGYGPREGDSPSFICICEWIECSG